MKRLAAGELEGLVLGAVWDAGAPVTPREVHAAIGASRGLAYTTVMTILVRLCQKGVLEREPAGRAYAYRPRVTREERAAARMSELLASAGDRSLALTHFLDALPPAEIDELRRALRRARDRR